MDKESFYKSIDEKHILNIEAGKIIIDTKLKDPSLDKRLGISLQISIDSFENKYNEFLDQFRSVLPNQYYYPYCDLHTTIFDFTKAKAEYEKNNSMEDNILDLVQNILKSIKSFSILYNGISFSSEAGIIRGYDNDMLINIRKKIRKALMDYNLKNDERYESQSAHITFLRFINPIYNPNKIIEMINRHKKKYFGEMKVAYVDLVEHDWYNLKNKKRIIKHFELEK